MMQAMLPAVVQAILPAAAKAILLAAVEGMQLAAVEGMQDLAGAKVVGSLLSPSSLSHQRACR